MNLLLLLLFQDYLKSMHTAKTTGNKKEKNNGIMEGTNNRICEVDFEIRLASCEFKRIAEEITRRKREREREPLEIRRRQERTQRELESANAKLWLAEHFKQS